MFFSPMDSKLILFFGFKVIVLPRLLEGHGVKPQALARPKKPMKPAKNRHFPKKTKEILWKSGVFS